jgi:AhpD family alkylhydroperoxidase
MTTCFFNYFVRFCEGAALPVEEWALKHTVAAVTASRYEAPAARVALVDNDEMNMASEMLAGAAAQAKSSNGLGISIANSQRAFMLVPSVFRAWRDYTGSTRDYDLVGREIKLHISFAVSMANDCRYCTLHQVLGLRRLGVDPAKLMSMAKSDSALTPRELTAVTFARKLTRDPASITPSDYKQLIAEFKEQGALEILLQTCNFAYMNRFTDGLRLPSEDEAVKTYLETYGKNYYEVRTSR